MCLSFVVKLTFVSSLPLPDCANKKSPLLWTFSIGAPVFLRSAKTARLLRYSFVLLFRSALPHRHTPVCLSFVVKLTFVSSSPLPDCANKKSPLSWTFSIGASVFLRSAKTARLLRYSFVLLFRSALPHRHTPVCLSFVVKLTFVSSSPLPDCANKKSPLSWTFSIGAPGGTRTHNLLIRSQMLYPIKLRAH